MSVVVTAEALGPQDEGTAELERAGPIGASTARRIACDASIAGS